MDKLVIHIFHVHENAALTGAKLAERIRQVAGGRGVALEVFVFGAAIGALSDPAQAEYRDGLAAVAKAGVPVNVCRQTVETMRQAEAVQAMGFGLETPATPSSGLRWKRRQSSACRPAMIPSRQAAAS